MFKIYLPRAFFRKKVHQNLEIESVCFLRLTDYALNVYLINNKTEFIFLQMLLFFSK